MCQVHGHGIVPREGVMSKAEVFALLWKLTSSGGDKKEARPV